jgi:hypothetical protein
LLQSKFSDHRELGSSVLVVIVGARRKNNKNTVLVQYVLKNGTGFKPGLKTSLKKKKEKQKLHIKVNYENRTAE